MPVQDPGPFFHGTRADLRVGDLLTAGFRSNYRPSVVMNHIYFTGIAKGAGLAAEMAKGDGRPRVYIVEPLGDFENDPNVTDKKFPGNPTRSYRSAYPLRIVGELGEWEPYEPEFITALRARIEAGIGEIINSLAARRWGDSVGGFLVGLPPRPSSLIAWWVGRLRRPIAPRWWPQCWPASAAACPSGRLR